jgi:hypothetical protein
MAALTGAASAQPPAPAAAKIAPVSPNARFGSTRGELRPDGACASVTLAALAANPACGTRLGRGESGPTLEVVMATRAAAPDDRETVGLLPPLDRAIAAEAHPALLYFAGYLLTADELTRRDCPRGVAYLERAVAGGNAAAADLLATMVLEGRGVPRDPVRAAALLERAAAGGMENSAMRLALLHLDGYHRPRDLAKGRRILEQAAAAGISVASVYIGMLDMERRSHGYQIHPSEDPAKVEVRDYTVIETPKLPPAFGFTDGLKQVHFSAYSDPALLARLERDHATLPSPFLFELARRMAAVSAEKAQGYYFLAQLRMNYDIERCVDSAEALQAMPLWDKFLLPDLVPAFVSLDPAGIQRAGKFALEREAAMPGDTRPWWICYAGMATYAAMADGKPPPLRLKPKAEWPALRKAGRDNLKQVLASHPR